MLLFRDMTGEPKAQMIRAMKEHNINPAQYDAVGNTLIQIICMAVSGKPLTIQFNSINGILNLTMVLLTLLKEIKGENVTAGSVSTGDPVLAKFMCNNN